MSKEFKIGLTVLIGIIVLFGAYVFLNTVSLKTKTYEIKTEFQDLEKLDTGAIVRLSGFKIGNVTDIQLTENSHVLVKMRIDKNINIPKDSYCMATTGAIIGEMFIKITPGNSNEYLENGDTIVGTNKASFDDLTKQVQKLLTITNSSMESVNELLGNKGYLINAMKNVDDITLEVKKLTKSMETTLGNVNNITNDVSYITGNSKEDLLKTVKNIKIISDNAVNISDDLDTFVNQDALPQVKILLREAGTTMESLNQTILTAKTLLVNVDSKIDNVDSLVKDADTILVKSQKTIDNLDNLLVSFDDVAKTTNSTMKKVDGILGDEETINNLKYTIENIRDTSKEAKILIEGINKRLGMKESRGEEKTFSANLSSENMYVNRDNNKFRSDLYTDIFFGKDGVKLGINDLGERNKGIIQYERKLDNNNIAKVGMFNSKLGLGYEYKYKNFSFQADWYNPNHSELYLKGKYKFTPNFGLFMGVDDLINKDNRNFLVGLSIEK